MQNYKVSIAYDGSNFYGFQKQKRKPTVQGKIEEVLNLLIKDYDLNYSGSTDAGVLAKFLPDFARVEGMSLFNLYHNYTVDEHLLKTVGFMSKIINNTLSQPHPFTSNFNAKLDNKKVLLLSAFLHDIGKGRKQDHSILGSQITEK